MSFGSELVLIFYSGIGCDNCGSKLGRARVICMDCQRATTSVDFCEDPTCAATTLGPDEIPDLKKPHLPTHETFKVYTVLHGRYYAMTERRAKETLVRARRLLTKENLKAKAGCPSSSGKPEGSSQACSHCNKKISLSPPCWACVECRKFLDRL